MQQPKDIQARGPYPNKIKECIKQRGYTLQEVADEVGISRRTLTNYVAGEVPTPRNYLEKIAFTIGCDIDELVIHPTHRSGTQPSPALLSPHKEKIISRSEQEPERDGCFSFGKLQTTWKTLDGDGRSIYLPQHIRSHYIPFAEVLPEELQTRKNQIQQEQKQKKEQGLPSFWNGEIYALDRFVIGREATNEDMVLDLWFRPSDYYTFLATNMSLKEPELREKYLSDVDWGEIVPHFSHSFGVSLAVVTSDGYTLFTQRGKNVGSRPSTYEGSVVEGLSRPIDRGTDGEAPDVYRCACRGLAEELGLHESIDFSVADITFLNFGVDTRYALRGLIMVPRFRTVA